MGNRNHNYEILRNKQKWTLVQFGNKELSPKYLGNFMFGESRRSRIHDEREAPRSFRRFAESVKERYGVEVKAMGGKNLDEYGESWINYTLLGPTEMSDEDLVSLFGYGPYYGGPGRSFGRCGIVRRTRTRTLITQSAGLDV